MEGRGLLSGSPDMDVRAPAEGSAYAVAHTLSWGGEEGPRAFVARLERAVEAEGFVALAKKLEVIWSSHTDH